MQRKTKGASEKACVCVCARKPKINTKSPRDSELVTEINVRYPLASATKQMPRKSGFFFSGGEKLAKKDKIKHGS